MSEEIKGLYYLENLDPKYIAECIQNIVESGKVFVDTVKVAEKYSWDEKAREVEKVYEFAKKNYLF